MLVNAWIFLDEDEPHGTNYNSPDSSYQALIKNNIYQSVDILSLCFVTTIPTSSNTIPTGDGSSYTLQIGPTSHPGGLGNQDYMNYIIRDARKSNPSLKITVTLNWGDGSTISNIFENYRYTPLENANNFATNLMKYLKYYQLDGFDVDWEPPISYDTTQGEFALLMSAIGAQFKEYEQQSDGKKYYLIMSPAVVGNLDADTINDNVDFINLQLYSGMTLPQDFVKAGIDEKLFAYGAKFENCSNSGNQQFLEKRPEIDPNTMGYQTALEAYKDNEKNYHYEIFTNWRLNSENFIFEQTQQQELYKLASQCDN